MIQLVPPHPEPNCLMPLSLSQVDRSVLQQLPEELKVDILESLPAHRRSELASNDVSPEFTMQQTGSVESVLSNGLWVGNPPRWVENFRLSSCWLLNAFAALFQGSGARSQLSSILQRIISEIYLPLDMGMNEMDDSVNCLCELIKQYVKCKVETDIEEIYVCARLLRR
jgi:DNA repair protein REV1